MMKKHLLIPLAALIGFTACVYEPEQFVASESEKGSESTTASDFGQLYSINGMLQVCNPSVSQDTVNYPGSMLWLNFGSLSVDVDDTTYATGPKRVIQHDRLTVSDTANKVQWFYMADTSKGECQFQDPEWTTHGGFVVTLRSFDPTGRKENSKTKEAHYSCKTNDLDFGIIAIRMSDKKHFVFYSNDTSYEAVRKEISSSATPHLWIDPSAKVDTSADASTLEGFFGTKNVRLTYVDPDDGIQFVDFSKVESNKDFEKALLNPVKLKAPASAKDGYMESQLFSPDGNFIVYNVIDKSMTGWEAYIQELSENSSPIQIEKIDGMMSAPAQPHWFAYDGRLFVEWAEYPEGETMTGQQKDLRDESMHDGSGGRTAMREVSLVAGAPADFAVEWIGNVREIAPVPMIGGRSPDGRFVATGDSKAFLLKLP